MPIYIGAKERQKMNDVSSAVGELVQCSCLGNVRHSGQC